MRKSSYLLLLVWGLLTATAVTAAPAPAAHGVQGIRLRPYADSLRLIFMFDRTAPYTFKEDYANQRATLEFMNTTLGSLPAELTRIKDPRLSGVWLKQHDGGLVTLELRFPAAAVRVEHFSLQEPATVVLDIHRTDLAAAQVSAAPEEQTFKPGPAAPETPAPLVPQPTPREPSAAERALAPPMVPGFTPSATPALPTAEIIEASSDYTPAITTATAAQHSTGQPPTPAEGTLAHDETKPMDVDYDFFPISALQAESPAMREILEDFMARRWATVIQKGLQFLEKNKINAETGSALHMMAEARWQLALQRPDEPLVDIVNMIQQAMRAQGAGDLGAFGAYRLAHAAMLMNDYDAALAHAEQAATSSQPVVRQRAVQMRLESLAKLRRYDESIATAAAAADLTSSTDQRVIFHVKEGNARTGKGDYAGAWEAYSKATALDAKWLSLDIKSGPPLALCALETDHLAEARKAVETIINFFSDEDKLHLLLLYARILALEGDTKTAEDVYFTMLRNIERTERGPEVYKKMLEVYPKELLDGTGRYALLLVQGGKIRQAMAELKRAYDDALREGAPAEGLNPALQTVLPLFMAQAVRQERPFEAMEAWKLYHHVNESEPLHRRCLAPLADAFEQLGLYEDALKLVRELREDRPTSATVSPLELGVQEGRLLVKSGQPDKAIPVCEELQPLVADGPFQGEVSDLLAQAYLGAGMALEGAQALQGLAGAPKIARSRRMAALTQAGEIFLQNNMSTQTVELGLKGLVLEKEGLEQAGSVAPDPSDGNALRLMLARAYQAQGDPKREQIVLEDLLKRPGLSTEQKSLAELRLSVNQRRTDRLAEAEQLYQAVSDDPAGDEYWRKTADQMRKILDWNRRHPDQVIDLNAPAPTAAQGTR